MGASSPGDGRLDLDDLGEVIDRARAIDPPVDDLLEGRDGVTWGERLESAGITPWLRRHRRRLVAGAAVVVLAGAGWTARDRSEPPPLDPVIRATADDAGTDSPLQFRDNASRGLLSTTVVVTPSTPGDVIEVRGLDGPGIRASSASPAATGTGAGRATDVTIVPGCDDPRALDASAEDYVLRVERTDPYGRITDGALPLPGSIGLRLAETTSVACVQQLLSAAVTPTRVTVRADDVRRVLHLDIGLHNGTGRDLTIFGIGSIGTSVATDSVPVTLAAGATVVVPVTATVLDCTAPQLDQVSPSYPGNPGSAREVDGLGFFGAPVDSVSGAGGDIVVPWTPAQRAEVRGALTRMCAGAPATAVTVLGAGLAPPAVRSAFGFADAQEGVGMRLRVEVRTTGSHVALSDGTQLLPDLARAAGTPTLTSTAADVVRGRTVLTVDWAAECSGPAAPPQAQLAVTAHGQTYPVHAVLNQAVLAGAYAAACPTLATDDLQAYGWASPA